MALLPTIAQAPMGFGTVPHPEPTDPFPLGCRENSIPHARAPAFVAEVLLWLLALGLLSPFVIYAGRETMPLPALFGVAAGIALALALAGRQLHSVLLADVLSGRGDRAKLALAAGMMLLVILLVLLGVVVALLLLFRRLGPSLTGPLGGNGP